MKKKRLGKRYGVDINAKYKNVLERLVDDKLIEDTPDSFTLTALGLFWAHNIGELFQTEEHKD